MVSEITDFPPPSPRFTCENVTIERGERVIFHQLSFSLAGGGFLLLKGANGVGKTSLIQALAGVRQPISGEIYWEDTPSRQHPGFKPELVYIGHKPGVKLACTVQEHIDFWAASTHTQAMAPAAMRYFDLNRKADMPAGQLSAGWRQRLALCRLLLSRGNLWLLDEPTNFLDAEAVALLSSLIESRIAAGGMIIAASHSMTSSFPAHVLQLEDFAP